MTSTEMHVYWGGDGLTLPTGEFRLILDSGAEVSGTGFSFDQKFSFKAGPKDEVRDHFIVSWDLPVDLSRAAALWVDGETIPLK